MELLVLLHIVVWCVFFDVCLIRVVLLLFLMIETFFPDAACDLIESSWTGSLTLTLRRITLICHS